MRLGKSLVLGLAAVSLAAAQGAHSAVPVRAPKELPAVCFAPDTPPEYVRAVYADLAARKAAALPPLFQFTDGSRWSSTATNGAIPAPTQGVPTTLTWSVVPDGTPITPAFPGESSAASGLKAFLTGIYGSEAAWRAIVQQEFDRWGALTGVTYVAEPNDDGATIPGPGGVLGVRGDVRIGGHSIDGNSGILAYNYFPNTGDMVIDAPDSFYNTTTSDSRRLRNVIAHEHGHGLGFKHVCPIQQTKLMEPFFSAAFLGPQHDDILAGNRGYGDDRENNDTSGTATNLGALGNGTVPVTRNSADDNSDVDFYKFTVAAGKQVDVTVTPIGFTYLEGLQNANGSCSAGTSFNSLVLNDVALEVRAPDGTTVLATANGQPAGVDEVLSNIALGTAGTYFVRVSAGANDKVQLYNLSLTVEDMPSVDLAITKTDGVASAVPGQTVTYTIAATNPSASTVTATVTDAFPGAITGVTWTCAASGGSSCGGASGSGNLNRTVTLASTGNGTVTFSATATINPSATGTLSNTASVSAVNPDPNPGNNSATDADTLTSQANLAITKTDGSATEIPGTSVTYTITVSNAGPSTAAAATVADTFPAAITGVTWTCTASAGSSCGAPSGAGNISQTVTLPPAGTATYIATGAISAGATGSLVNAAAAAAPGGTTDPVPGNNSATDTDTLVPTADFRVDKTDNKVRAVPGQANTYFITVTNLGPSDGTATLTDNFPAALVAPNWTCSASAGSSCGTPVGVGDMSVSLTLLAGGVASAGASGTINAAATGTLSNTASVAATGGTTDPDLSNNSDTDTDNLTLAMDELNHGLVRTRTLAGASPAGRHDYFMYQSPRASYEVVVDGASGDIVPNLLVQRLDGDGSVAQTGTPVSSVDSAVSLRWANPSSSPVDGQTIRVQSGFCTSTCGAEDTYRIRVYETTASIPRFNNAGSQVTVLVLQNPAAYPITGTAWLWSTSGPLLGSQPFSLAAKQTVVVNTSTITGAAGASGTITVSHDGRYGDLTGKTVALEPSTGFSFDSPLLPRPR